MNVFYKTGYVADMMDPAPDTDTVLAILTAQFERPDKEEVIASYVSRFNQGPVYIAHSDLQHQETPCRCEGPHKLE